MAFQAYEGIAIYFFAGIPAVDDPSKLLFTWYKLIDGEYKEVIPPQKDNTYLYKWWADKSDEGSYHLYCLYDGAEIYRNDFDVVVNPGNPPYYNPQPTDLTVNEGDLVPLNFKTDGIDISLWKEINGVWSQQGGHLKDHLFQSAELKDAGKYRLESNVLNGQTAISQIFNIAVEPRSGIESTEYEVTMDSPSRMEGDHIEFWLRRKTPGEFLLNTQRWLHLNPLTNEWVERKNPPSINGWNPLHLSVLKLEDSGQWRHVFKPHDTDIEQHVNFSFIVKPQPDIKPEDTPSDNERDDFLVPSENAQITGLKLEADGLLFHKGIYHIGDIPNEGFNYTVKLVPEYSTDTAFGDTIYYPRITNIEATEITTGDGMVSIRPDYGTSELSIYVHGLALSPKKSTKIKIKVVGDFSQIVEAQLNMYFA